MKVSEVNEIIDFLVSQIKINDLVGFIILTGSYKNFCSYEDENIADDVDINMYIFTSAGFLGIFDLNKQIKDAIESLKENCKSISFEIDLHPYAFSMESIEIKKKKIQFTCRTISLYETGYYPEYILKGWHANHKLLFCGDETLYKEFLSRYSGLSLNMSTHYLEGSILAFNSYINAIQILPLFTADKDRKIREIERYFKEILKDGIRWCFSEEDLEQGKFHKFINNYSLDAIFEKYKAEFGEEIYLLLLKKQDYSKDIYLKSEEEKEIYIRFSIELFEKIFRVLLVKLKNKMKNVDPSQLLNTPLLWW